MSKKRANETTIDLSDPRYFLDREPAIQRLRARETELTVQRKRNRATLAGLREQAEKESRGGGVSRRRAAAEALAGGVAVVEAPSIADQIRELESENLRIADALGVIAEDLRMNHINRVSGEICSDLGDHYKRLVARVASAVIELSRANTRCMELTDVLEARGVQPSSLPGYGLRFAQGRVGTLRDTESGVRGFLREVVKAGAWTEAESKAAIEGNER